MSASVRYVPRDEVGARPNIVVDGAPLDSTVLTLSHWPVNSTPEPYRRDTSTETALAWVARNDPASVAAIVTNNHFDEDGLLSMFTVLEPRAALGRRELLADAARAGDFGIYRSRESARLCFTIESLSDPAQSPLPAEALKGPESRRTAALYRHMLSRLPRILAQPQAYRRYWREQDEHLDASEELVTSGRLVIEEEPELDLAIVRIPEDAATRRVLRYLSREQAEVHPFAIHSATRCTRLVRLRGRRIEVQFRYESWLQVQSRRPALRVDLTPFCCWLNRHEANGTWTWENTLGIAPRLRLARDAASSIPPAMFLRELRHYLRTLPVAWDPYHWQPADRAA